MKTRLLSGFLAVVGGGALFVGCFEPTRTVVAETPRVVSSPTPAPAPLAPQPTPTANNTPAVATVPTALSPGISEVAKLYQSNVSEDVLLAYVNNYGQPFYATADEILYLNDLGVSDNVVTAVLNYKAEGNPQNVPAPAPQPEPAPAPAPQVAATAPLVPQEPVASAASAPATQVTVNHFYDTLSPYGTWVETEYGRSWRPAVVVSNPEWRPYCDRGHWIYTDCGWYWVSDYSWGWATFHYGRWCSDYRFGWVWVPDTTWGPSWVSWRYTSDHCGWAPLPPLAHFDAGVGFTFRSASVGISFDFGLTESCYTFVPVDRFCDPHPYRYCAPRSSTTIIYKNSTVINNYIVNKNTTTIVNEGVGRHRIEGATKQPIQKVAIQEMPKNNWGSPDRVHKVGKDMVIYKPQAPEVVKPRFTATVPVAAQNNGNSRVEGRTHGRSDDTSNAGRGRNDRNDREFRRGASSEAASPRVITQPKVNEVVSQPNVSAQPRHETGRNREERARQLSNTAPEVKATAPATPAWGSQKAVPVPQRQAPEVQAEAPSRGRPDRSESLRPSAPVAAQAQAPLVPQTPSRNFEERESRGHQDRAEVPSEKAGTWGQPSTSSPAPRAQTMSPGLPRSAQQSMVPRGQGQGGGQNSGRERPDRSDRSERLAEKDSSNHGQGGRNRY